jgi:hypothetical protein
MLAQQTGQNVANQAALMAGQRGSGANAGLLARQAAQQGANTQQQSAGQAATMQSQQQLNAINALQGQQNSMANLATTQAGQQIGATNTAANLAQQQQGMVQQYGLGQENLALQNQGQIIAAAQAFNAQKLSDVQQQNASNAAVQNTTAGGQSKMGNGIISGMMNGASSMAGSMGSMAEGGEVTLPDQPGTVSTPTPADADDGSEWKPSSGGGGGGGGGGGSGAALMALAAMANGGQVGSNQVGSNAILKENYKGPKSKLGMHLASHAKGGHVKHVDAMVSPGEIILSKDKAEAVKQGKASPLSGKKVPGQAPVGGAKNSYANDVVPAKLEAGGIVLPRSVTQSANPGAAAKKFIDALKSKKGK